MFLVFLTAIVLGFSAEMLIGHLNISKHVWSNFVWEGVRGIERFWRGVFLAQGSLDLLGGNVYNTPHYLH